MRFGRNFLAAVLAAAPIFASAHEPAPQIRFKLGQSGADAQLVRALDGAEAQAALYADRDALLKYPTLKAHVWGFADDGECTGSRCRDLARARAEAVRTWLVREGVAPERLQVDSFGTARPLENGSSPRNRRVEIGAVIEKRPAGR
ncbi:OmpA family protein [Lysobacter xanthus]